MNLKWRIAQTFEIRWWRHYLKDKPESDYRSWKQNYWEQFLSTNKISFSGKEQILDIGCGPAGIYMVLNNHVVDAVDPLLGKYSINLDHFNPSDYQHVRFHQIPFEDFELTQKYDKVFCLNAINHVADLEKCFDKLATALKPGGQFIVSIDAHNFQFSKFLFRLIPGDILHPHQYDLKDYEQMLEKRGCKIEYAILYKEALIFNYYVICGKLQNGVTIE